jgi:hypothetical protein
VFLCRSLLYKTALPQFVRGLKQEGAKFLMEADLLEIQGTSLFFNIIKELCNKVKLENGKNWALSNDGKVCLRFEAKRNLIVSVSSQKLSIDV